MPFVGGCLCGRLRYEIDRKQLKPCADGGSRRRRRPAFAFGNGSDRSRPGRRWGGRDCRSAGRHCMFGGLQPRISAPANSQHHEPNSAAIAERARSPAGRPGNQHSARLRKPQGTQLPLGPLCVPAPGALLAATGNAKPYGHQSMDAGRNLMRSCEGQSISGSCGAPGYDRNVRPKVNVAFLPGKHW